MNNSLINVGWYTRAGHVDLWSKISQSLSSKTNIKNHYVCHTRNEKNKLISKYDIYPSTIGDFIDDNIIDRDIKGIIKKLERKYPSIPLRMLLWSEMFEMENNDKILIKRLIHHFDFWENFLSSTKIKVIFSEGPSILSTCVLWVVCKKYSIELIELTPVGLPGRKNFRTTWGDGIDNFYDEIKKVVIDKESDNYKKTVKYFDKMKNNPSKPLYANIELETGLTTKNKSYKFFPKLHKKLNRTTFRTFLNFKSNNNYYLNNVSFSKFYYDWFTTKLKYHYITKTNIFDQVLDDDFFLFPLHILNEWSDYPWMGLNYPHVSILIEKIAACLPIGSKLYVKEHPSLFPHKSIDFYIKIKKIPNVKLIGPFEDNFNLIKKSKGILTMGATTGWEAFIIGKPVIIFCNVWYHNLKGIYKVKTEFDLVKILQTITTLTLPNSDYIKKVIYTLFKISFEAEHYPLSKMTSDKNIKKVSDKILKYLSHNYFKKK